MSEQLSEWVNSLLYISGGIRVTLQYTLISVTFGLIIGSLLALAKVSKIGALNKISSVYTSVFRGTPLLVQLSLIYFAIPQLTGYQMSVFEAGIITFSLNSGAYVSEIIRAGIQSIDKGQFEAAKALAIPYRPMMLDIILPQAVRNILPALVNEVINLLKESALISVIGGSDLMRRAQIVTAEQYSYFGPLLIAAIYYYIMVLILTYFAEILEKKIKIND